MTIEKNKLAIGPDGLLQETGVSEISIDDINFAFNLEIAIDSRKYNIIIIIKYPINNDLFSR